MVDALQVKKQFDVVMTQKFTSLPKIAIVSVLLETINHKHKNQCRNLCCACSMRFSVRQRNTVVLNNY